MWLVGCWEVQPTGVSTCPPHLPLCGHGPGPQGLGCHCPHPHRVQECKAQSLWEALSAPSRFRWVSARVSIPMPRQVTEMTTGSVIY